MLNFRDQEITFRDFVEIRKQSVLDKADGPESEPRDRTMTVLKLTGRLGLNETGIKMFENSDWNEQRTAATGQGIVRKFAFRDETLKDMKGPLSRQISVCDYFHALPALLLDVKGKGKAVPLQAWTGPEGSRKLRFPYFVTMAQDGGRLSALSTGRHYPPEILLVLISVRG